MPFVNINKMGSTIQESSGLFSSFTNMFGNIKMNTTTIVFLLAIVFFVILGVYYYYYHFSPRFHITENYENKTNNNKVAEVMFFYTDWCPHCKVAKPVWSEIESEYENKKINGYKLIFTSVNCTNETPEIDEMLNKYKIEGYPTIKLLKDDQVIEYDAKVNKDTMKQFLNSVI